MDGSDDDGPTGRDICVYAITHVRQAVPGSLFTAEKTKEIFEEICDMGKVDRTGGESKFYANVARGSELEKGLYEFSRNTPENLMSAGEEFACLVGVGFQSSLIDKTGKVFYIVGAKKEYSKTKVGRDMVITSRGYTVSYVETQSQFRSTLSRGNGVKKFSIPPAPSRREMLIPVPSNSVRLGAQPRSLTARQAGSGTASRRKQTNRLDADYEPEEEPEGETTDESQSEAEAGEGGCRGPKKTRRAGPKKTLRAGQQQHTRVGLISRYLTGAWFGGRKMKKSTATGRPISTKEACEVQTLIRYACNALSVDRVLAQIHFEHADAVINFGANLAKKNRMMSETRKLASTLVDGFDRSRPDAGVVSEADPVEFVIQYKANQNEGYTLLGVHYLTDMFDGPDGGEDEHHEPVAERATPGRKPCRFKWIKSVVKQRNLNRKVDLALRTSAGLSTDFSRDIPIRKLFMSDPACGLVLLLVRQNDKGEYALVVGDSDFVEKSHDRQPWIYAVIPKEILKHLVPGKSDARFLGELTCVQRFLCDLPEGNDHTAINLPQEGKTASPIYAFFDYDFRTLPKENTADMVKLNKLGIENANLEWNRWAQTNLRTSGGTVIADTLKTLLKDHSGEKAPAVYFTTLTTMCAHGNRRKGHFSGCDLSLTRTDKMEAEVHLHGLFSTNGRINYEAFESTEYTGYATLMWAPVACTDVGKRAKRCSRRKRVRVRRGLDSSSEGEAPAASATSAPDPVRRTGTRKKAMPTRLRAEDRDVETGQGGPDDSDHDVETGQGGPDDSDHDVETGQGGQGGGDAQAAQMLLDAAERLRGMQDKGAKGGGVKPGGGIRKKQKHRFTKAPSKAAQAAKAAAKAAAEQAAAEKTCRMKQTPPTQRGLAANRGGGMMSRL